MNIDNILLRLKKAEGQVRGIQQMVEHDRYWMDIVHQISAVQSATKNVAVVLVENHVRESIESAIENGNVDEEVKEIIQIVKHFVK